MHDRLALPPLHPFAPPNDEEEEEPLATNPRPLFRPGSLLNSIEDNDQPKKRSSIDAATKTFKGVTVGLRESSGRKQQYMRK